jgi:hypothetical protein
MEHLSSISKALGSIPTTAEREREKREREREKLCRRSTCWLEALSCSQGTQKGEIRPQMNKAHLVLNG